MILYGFFYLFFFIREDGRFFFFFPGEDGLSYQGQEWT